MAVYCKTSGFVLKSKNRGEVDQLFTVFTENIGKIKILARGIRKINSKLRGNFQLFNLCEIEFVQGKTYKTLTDAIVLNSFSEIKKNEGKLEIISEIADVADSLIKDQDKDVAIWKLLEITLERLANEDSELIYYYFLWKLLEISGYKPELYSCLLCHNRLKPKGLYFSSQNGGLVCWNCFKEHQGLIEILPDTVKVLRLILEKNSKKIKINQLVFKNLKQVSNEFLSYILAENS
ncbi:MAG: DNA repair protein RecO [Patescibacteria group bacterium]